MIECCTALFFVGSTDIWPYVLFATLVVFLYCRCQAPWVFNPWIMFFAFYYLSCNLCVNLTDFVWRKQYMGIEYYHDDEFSMSFSYRTHQFILFALLALVSSQLLCPGLQQDSQIGAHFEAFTEGIRLVFYASVPISISLIVSFLLELTSWKAEVRGKIFKTELVKVFLTVVFFYAFTLGLTTWL